MEDHLPPSLWDLRFHGIQLSKNSAEHGKIHEKYEAKISYNWDVKERIIFNPTTVRDKTEKTFVRYRNISSYFSVRLWWSHSWFHFNWEHLELESCANLTDLTHTHRNRAGTRISISWDFFPLSSQKSQRIFLPYMCRNFSVQVPRRLFSSSTA